MQLGLVIGTVVASAKDPAVEGIPLLIVQPLDRHSKPSGSAFVAADALGTAGPGQLVYWVGAREAAEALAVRFAPVDHAIVGIVDAIRPVEGAEP